MIKQLTNRKPFKIYPWFGLAFLSVWLLHTAIDQPETFSTRALNETWRVLFVTIVNYLLFEYILLFIIKRRRNLLYNLLLAAVCLWLVLLVYAFGGYIWRSIGINLNIYTPFVTYKNAGKAASASLGYGLGSMIFFGVLRHIYSYIKLRQSAQQLRIEKQQAELNYLKSQTNPHFLFNTLNNIYALTRDKSDLAPESVMRLSKILRYMLYEASGDYIALEQEMKIIMDYIELEKLRYDESLRVNFNYDLEDMRQALPPLLLMPLVENAFKHGVSETRNQPFIDIHLSVKQRKLVLIVKNSTGNMESGKEIKENIGLGNLRRQLELLYSEYDLSLNQEKFVFTTMLKINLASHV